jgi:hypothetical protein
MSSQSHMDHLDLTSATTDAQLMKRPSLAALSAAIESDPSLTALEDNDDHHHHPGHGHGGDSDEDKKRRREIFRFIAGMVLRYHGLKKAHTIQELAENSTWPTALESKFGANGGLPQRIRVEKSLVPPCE